MTPPAPSRVPSGPSAPHVVVLGGGVAGIAAARRLSRAGAHVTVLESDVRLGGCVRTVDFRGDRVDVGAEALFTAAPEPLKLVADLGLTDDLVASRHGPTWIASPRGLRALPAGVGPAGPTRLRPLLSSRLLGPAGLARAALEPLVPSTATEDPSVGEVLARRFGRQVVDRIVDPLLGGLHAGDVDADAVVVTVPAVGAGHVLASLDPQVAPALAAVRAASVAVALLAYPRREADRPTLRGTGVLLPSTAGRLLKAATFVTTKWPHLSPDHVLVRASAGRADDRRAAHLGDAELVDALARDLAEVAGLDAAPLDHRVVRWDQAMPQLEVGHRQRIDHVRARLAPHPGVVLAGASYDGVGVASAVRSGTAAAHQVLAHLTGATT